jgi:hypothetical protein
MGLKEGIGLAYFSVTISLWDNLCTFFVKVRDLNELSRKEVDEIIKVCMKQDCISPNDNIRKR